MGNQIRELERAIEVLKGAPTVDEGQRKLLEDRLVRLRNEKGRLVERFRDQEIVMQAMASAKAVAGQEYSKRVMAVEGRVGEQGRKRDLVNDTRSYGTLPSMSAGGATGSGTGPAAKAAANCANCGLDYSLGSLGTQP
jgi:hypothetical protein